MARTFKDRPKRVKQNNGPEPSVIEPLIEVMNLLYSLPIVLHEDKLKAALKATFGSVHKGYGSIIALRNVLRSVKTKINGG